ncbi:UNVERIFIED_CONTAM: hypothetical protein K2H54_047911 [Gekko kuhli]
MTPIEVRTMFSPYDQYIPPLNQMKIIQYSSPDQRKEKVLMMLHIAQQQESAHQYLGKTDLSEKVQESPLLKLDLQQLLPNYPSRGKE